MKNFLKVVLLSFTAILSLELYAETSFRECPIFINNLKQSYDFGAETELWLEGHSVSTPFMPELNLQIGNKNYRMINAEQNTVQFTLQNEVRINGKLTCYYKNISFNSNYSSSIVLERID